MSEDTSRPTSTLHGLLKRTGGSYYLIAVGLAQLLAFPGSLLGSYIIQINARFSPQQYNSSLIASLILVSVGAVVVVGGAFLYNRDFRLRLAQWQEGRPMSGGSVESNAWKQATSLAWRYGAVATAVSIFLVTLPLLAYQSYWLSASRDQLLYTLFGSLISTIVVAISGVLLLENMLLPTRAILLPTGFEAQLAGANSLNLRRKFLIVIAGLILFSILLIAPIGYQKTNEVLFEAVGSAQVVDDLQRLSGIAAAVSLVVGAVLAYLLSQSVAEPLRNMIDVFGQVEKGNLGVRATVMATDEIGELAVYFNRMVSQLAELQENLEQRVQEQTSKLRASNEVGQIASTILDPDELVGKVVQLITESFGYYYAAIFIIDDAGRWAVLKDATGAAGEALKARRHRLQLGGNSMVATAINTKNPQIALDVGVAAVRFNNPLLPNTRSEIAIPLMVGERVIGALDVQSTKEAEFRSEEVSTLQGMANQVAIAIENARLFKEMDQALTELQQTNRQYIISAWTEKLKSGKLEYATKNPPPLTQLESEIRDVEVKMHLRDETIGRISIEADSEWSQEDQAWVEALATQVAISLENARLVEESQQSALRERLTASIVQKLWASNSIDTILQTTVRELGRALEASEATIELKLEE